MFFVSDHGDRNATTREAERYQRCDRDRVDTAGYDDARRFDVPEPLVGSSRITT